MRLIKHLLLFGACASLVFLLLTWAAGWSLSTLVPSDAAPLSFTKADLRREAVGDVCFSVLCFPTRVILPEKWMHAAFIPSCIILDAAILYGGSFALFYVWKRTKRRA